MIFKNLIVAQLLHGYQNEFFNKGTCCAITALTTAFTVYGQKIKNWQRKDIYVFLVTQLLCDFNWTLKLKTPETLVFPRGTPLCQSDRSRQWPGKLASSNPALCKRNSQYYTVLLREKDWLFAAMKKLHLLHYNPRPQVKVLLYNLQQLVFIPVRRAIVKHWDGEWMAHTDSIGDLQGV